MSAFLVGRAHVAYLVQAALWYTGTPHGFSWWCEASGRRIDLPKFKSDGRDERAAEIGQMLWTANAASVNHRYSEADEPPVYGKHVAPGFLRPNVEPDHLQVIQAAQCLDYQSCERDDWNGSKAWAFLEGLKSAAIGRMIDRRRDEIHWTIPDVAPKGPEIVSLMDMIG